MKIKTAADYKLLKDSVVTIGTFDGVHIGHQTIIDRLTTIAKAENLQAVVLTFFPHPRLVVQNDTSVKLINTIDEKAKLLQQKGIDHLVVKSFTKEFSRLTALEYVRDVLVNTLHVKHIIVGYDHHFGRNRTANISDLREYGDFYDFKVTEINAQEVDNVAVSSTKIRRALAEGDISTANRFLGYQFMLNAKVIKGKGLGHTIGFPTANLKVQENYKLIPKTGVYLVKSVMDSKPVYGMMNIGHNPTVGMSNTIALEVHYLEFDGNLYGHTLEIQFLERLRDEQKFESINDLQQQLQRDRQACKAIIQHQK